MKRANVYRHISVAQSALQRGFFSLSFLCGAPVILSEGPTLRAPERVRSGDKASGWQLLEAQSGGEDVPDRRLNQSVCSLCQTDGRKTQTCRELLWLVCCYCGLFSKKSSSEQAEHNQDTQRKNENCI